MTKRFGPIHGERKRQQRKIMRGMVYKVAPVFVNGKPSRVHKRSFWGEITKRAATIIKSARRRQAR